jgi:hypothetical protein
MPFRLNLIDPESLSLMSEAFDKAWLAINASTPIAVLLQPDARDYLSHGVFGLWQGGERTALSDQAVSLFKAKATWA